MSKFFRLRTIIIAILVIAILVAGYAIWQNGPQPSEQETARVDESHINYEPATEGQKNAAGIPDKDANQNTTNDDNDQPTSVQNKQSVDVVITTWTQNDGKVKVNGYAAGIVENGGTCTLTLEKNGQRVTASRPAQPNVSTTTCGQSTIDATELSSGIWQATLSYSSDNYEGTSEPVAIEVSNG